MRVKQRLGLTQTADDKGYKVPGLLPDYPHKMADRNEGEDHDEGDLASQRGIIVVESEFVLGFVCHRCAADER